MKLINITLLLACAIITAHAKPLERLFYLTPDAAHQQFSPSQLQRIHQHANAIDVLAPQVYQLAADGTISGHVDPQLLSLGKQHHLPIMPLVVNPNFNQEKFHQFLHNHSAQAKALANLLTLCQQQHLHGLQFDFENILAADKALFTAFFQAAAQRLHAHGFRISIAVVPRTVDNPRTDYQRWVAGNWSGAYDYKALAKHADFISVMSYDQHTSLTTPGPIAALDWVDNSIQGLLKLVPAHKLSLGIPTYSGHWTTGKLDPGHVAEKFIYRSKERQISYAKALDLLAEFKPDVTWHKQWQSSYALYSNQGQNEFLFIEDSRSFQAKLALAKRHQLRGISVWKLGLEDPRSWRDQNLRPGLFAA